MTTDQQPVSQLSSGTYEVLRNRLRAAADELKRRIDGLNAARGEVFGNIDTRLLSTAHVTTEHNCVPRDIVAIGPKLLLGYNVQFGLKTEIVPSDVLSAYRLEGDIARSESLDLIADDRFQRDFVELFRYYKNVSFSKFFTSGPYLYFVLQVGKTAADIKAFKWQIHGETLKYVDNRSEHEVKFPSQHEFKWRRATRDMHREGLHPHISIEDLVFVECVGGDLTVKVEDNTEQGSGIYSEPVENADQTLDDGEIHFAIVGNLVLMKIRPYLEKDFRYLVFNVKRQDVRRIDPIAQACVLLPDDHGIIFPGGYQLQTGTFKLFEHGLQDMLYERTIASPNGEDFLYLFYNRTSGATIQLRYNLIRQEVDTPLVCHGQAIFNDGQMICFRNQQELQKHHALQVWQTPFVGPNFRTVVATDSMLYKIGNAELVRGAAECQELLQLIQRDEEYADLYVDLVKRSTVILDSYFWIDKDETKKMAEPVSQIREAAAAAVEEFAKVVRLRRETEAATTQVERSVTELIKEVQRSRFESVDDFVSRIAAFREQRGHAIGLREQRYVDESRVSTMEKTLIEEGERLSRRCVDALLDANSLSPYRIRVEAAQSEIAQIKTAAEGRKLDAKINEIAAALQLLVDTIGALKIDDTTKRTAIVERCGELLGELNRVRSGLRAHLRSLIASEMSAEFASQCRLLDQAVAGALETADSPDKVDQSLTRMMLQLQELEGRFAEADEFVARLVEKRESIYETFEVKKQQLVEARSRRAEALAGAADRVLTGINNRAMKIDDADILHSFFAADPMVEKVRQITDQLKELGDSVRMNDLLGRLKAIGDDAIRQLRDRKDLYSEGDGLIRLGNHSFAVNKQPIELTTVVRDGKMQLHLTGSQFFEPLSDPALDQAVDLWEQSLISENGWMYRGEFLAAVLFRHLQGATSGPHGELPVWQIRQYLAASVDERMSWIRQHIGPRHREGYARGVHDHDAMLLLNSLLKMHQDLGLLRYQPTCRARGWFVWNRMVPEPIRNELLQWLEGFKTVVTELPKAEPALAFRRRMNTILARCGAGLLDVDSVTTIVDYLIAQLLSNTKSPIVSSHALDLYHAFEAHLPADRRQRVANALQTAGKQPAAAWALAENAVDAFLADFHDLQHVDDPAHWYRDELVRLLLAEPTLPAQVMRTSVAEKLTSLAGDHARLDQGKMVLHYFDFQQRMHRYQQEVVPRFEALRETKLRLLDSARNRLKVDEFKPRVLTSFVRNLLLDEVYLPRIGDNLAKQMGAAGKNKRTDRMGLLLLISPPGYGKTTLMEYVANRLGLVFVKVNGPALGHSITSLDPAEATNAAAKQEILRINLALEMGDNVMLYLDDIQHCNPELLQKFIPLCDATRRIEGVWQGVSKTYDLRGRQVAVVMAGNPYTESGDRFQIPDMLANRADVYNLGEIIGDARLSFEMSYLENCLTSNSTLQSLTRASSLDQRALIRAAELGTADGVELETPIAADQVREMVQVLTKLMRVRDVVLRVNRAYIRSAAQADAYRTEPPFKLQGSYRNMNKIAERVVPVMNDLELETLIVAAYEQDAQTLTRDSESNLLKFKEILGKMSKVETERWEAIKYAYVESVRMTGIEGEDTVAKVLRSISGLRDGLESIRRTMAQAVAADKRDVGIDRMQEGMSHLQSTLNSVGGEITRAMSGASDKLLKLAEQNSEPPDPRVLVQHTVPRVLIDLVRSQFQLLYDGLRPVLEQSKMQEQSMERVEKSLKQCLASYQDMLGDLNEAKKFRELDEET